MAAHTAPYLHDGSAATLRDAVDIMFEFQLGREAPEYGQERHRRVHPLAGRGARRACGGHRGASASRPAIPVSHHDRG